MSKLTEAEIVKVCGEVCSDNRFELIEKYKKELFEHTNIQTSKGELDALDSILFRCWQMGWLDKLEEYDRQKAEIERLQQLQKPTGAGGFKVENGKVVYYSDMLNGYRHEFKDIDEIVKELNLYMHTDYKNIELISHYKHKLQTIKAEAIKELREKCNEHQDFHKGDDGVFRAYISIEDLDNIISDL